MNTRIYTILEKIGLSEKEIKLYVTALELGTQGMTKLAKRAGLKRSTAYTVYESLEKKGFMGSYKRSSGMFYFAISPQKIFERIRQNALDVKDILPELDALENKNTRKPKIMYYEGVENYKRILEETLQTPNTEIVSYGNIKPILDILGVQYDEEYYVPKRIKNNIFIRVLACDNFARKTPAGREDKKLKRDIKYFPKKIHMHSFTIVYGNKVANIHVGENIYMTVSEARYLADDERTKFELLWNKT